MNSGRTSGDAMKWPLVLAVFLELAMLAVFVLEQAPLGVMVWFAYFYFSATRALVFEKWL